MRRALALFVVRCAWLLCPPAPAHAEPTALEAADTAPGGSRLVFGWNAPEGCPSREAVLARAERLLGHPLAASLKAPLVIDATATELGAERWELRLVSGGAGAEPRLVTAASCAELGEVAALFTALSIDPTLKVEPTATSADSAPAKIQNQDSAAARPAEPPPASPAPPPARPEERTSSPASSPQARAKPSPVRPLVAASVMLGLGRLPGPAFGVGAEGGIALDRLSLRALFGYFPKQHAEATPTTGGDLSLAVVGARAVYVLTEGAPTFALSGGATLGWLHGTGTGVTYQDSGDALLVSLEPGVRGGYALSPSWSLFAEAGLTVAINRPRFVLDGDTEVYQPSTVGGRFGLGAEWCPR